MLIDTPSPTHRTFVALRKSGRAPAGRAPVFHAVTPYCRMALCADKPGASSGWAEPPAESVTCPKCRAKLARLEIDAAIESWGGPGVRLRKVAE